MKAGKFDVWFIAWIRRNILRILLAAAVAASLAIRIFNLGYISRDFTDFLLPWFNEIKAQGGLVSLGQTIGNYNVLYMFLLSLLSYLPIDPLYSIKALSIVFDYVGALAAALLVRKLLSMKRDPRAETWGALAFIAVLFLPTVLLNASLWAQCDFMYASLLLLCLYELLEERYTRAFLFVSLAFCLKIQAVFLLPLLVIYYFTERKFSAANFLMIPAAFLLTSLPALLLGRPFLSLFKPESQIGIGMQTGAAGYENMTSIFYPNLYYLLGNNADWLFPGILATLLALGLLLGVILQYNLRVRGENILSLALLIVLLCVFLMPCMHERYAFFADVLSVVCFCVNRRHIHLPIGINLVSLLSYCPILFGATILPYPVLALCHLTLLVLVARNTFLDLRADTQRARLEERIRLPFPRLEQEKVVALSSGRR